jgi:hypothetical protein
VGFSLAQYAINIKQPPASHNLLVGLPLILIIILSFSFLLVHPGTSKTVQAKVTKDTVSEPQPETVQIVSPPSAEVKAPVAAPAAASSANAASSNPHQAASGPAPAEKPKTSNPQGAAQNHGSNATITGVVKDTTKKLGL